MPDDKLNGPAGGRLGGDYRSPNSPAFMQLAADHDSAVSAEILRQQEIYLAAQLTLGNALRQIFVALGTILVSASVATVGLLGRVGIDDPTIVFSVAGMLLLCGLGLFIGALNLTIEFAGLTGAEKTKRPIPGERVSISSLRRQIAEQNTRKAEANALSMRSATTILVGSCVVVALITIVIIMKIGPKLTTPYEITVTGRRIPVGPLECGEPLVICSSEDYETQRNLAKLPTDIARAVDHYLGTGPRHRNSEIAPLAPTQNLTRRNGGG